MMAEIIIRPCPFCGGMAIMETVHIDRRAWTETTYKVKCARCGCETPIKPSEELAADAWNVRYEPGAPDNDIATFIPACNKSLSIIASHLAEIELCVSGLGKQEV